MASYYDAWKKSRGEEDDDDKKKQQTTSGESTSTSDNNLVQEESKTSYYESWMKSRGEEIPVDKPKEQKIESEPVKDVEKPVVEQKKNIWEKIKDTFQKLTKLTQAPDDGTDSDVDKEARRKVEESTMKEVPTSEVLKRYQEDPVGYLVSRPYYSSKDKYLEQDKDLSTKDVMEKKLQAYGDYYNSLDEVGKAKLTNPVEGLSDDSYAYIKLNTDNILKETDLEIQTLYSQLETAEGKDARQIKKYLGELEEQKKDLEYIQKGVVENKGFIEGLKEGFTDVKNIPVVGSIIRADEAIDTLRAWRKYENGEDLSTREKMLVNRIKTAEIESISEEKDIGYNIASGVATSVSLIVEVGLALAIPTPVDGEIALATRGASGVGKFAIGAGNLLWKAGKITATTGVPKIIESTATYQAPEMSFDWEENDFDKIEEGDEFSDALLKSIAKEYGNNLIEVGLGDTLDASTKAVKKGIANMVGKEIQATSKNQVITFLRTKGGWNGFLGEFSEEIAQKYYEEGVIDNKEVKFTPEELVAIAGSVLLLQGAGEVVGQFGAEQDGMREQIEAEAEANIRATVQEADKRTTEEGGITVQEEIGKQDTPVVDVEEEMLKADIAQVEQGLEAEPVQEVKIEEGEVKTDYSQDAQVQEVLRDISLVLDAGARKKVVSKVEGSESMGYDTQDYTYGVEGMIIPEFIPEELRSRKIVEKAYDAFLNNTIPQEGTKAWQVYQAILEESRGREGLEVQKPEVTPEKIEVEKGEYPMTKEAINAEPIVSVEEVTKRVAKMSDEEIKKRARKAGIRITKGTELKFLRKDIERIELGKVKLFEKGEIVQRQEYGDPSKNEDFLMVIEDKVEEVGRREDGTYYYILEKGGDMRWGYGVGDLKKLEAKPKTQKDKVKEVLKEGKKKSIKEIAKETKILEPNVRRILGVGTKEGTFERVAEGVYVLKKGDKQVAYIQAGNALVELPKLAKKGFKADMVFLDIPYKTPAITGGNRGMKYDLISPDEFGTVLDAVNDILRSADSPVIYMFSQAKSGMKEMMKYNDMLDKKGLKVIARGEWQKRFKNGKMVTNVRGEVSEPEGILLLSQSGVIHKEVTPIDLKFDLVRPKGYQSEKNADMIAQMIQMTTKEGDVVLDPFAGSGVVPAEAVRSNRSAVALEIDEKVVEETIIPRVEKASGEVEPIPYQLEDLAIEAQSMTGYDFNQKYGYLFTTIGDGDTTYQYYKGSVEDFFRTAQTFKKPTPDNIQRELDELTDDDLPFRQRELKILEDKFLDKLTIERMKEFSREWFGDENVEVVKNILRNKKALGMYLNRLIEIKSGQAHVGSTFYHEAIHKAFDIFLTPEEKSAMIREVIKRIGKKELLIWGERNGYTREKNLDMKFRKSIVEEKYNEAKRNIIPSDFGVKTYQEEYSIRLLESFGEKLGFNVNELWNKVVTIMPVDGEIKRYFIDNKEDATIAQAIIKDGDINTDGSIVAIDELTDELLSNSYFNIDERFVPSMLPYSDNLVTRSEQREFRKQFGVTEEEMIIGDKVIHNVFPSKEDLAGLNELDIKDYRKYILPKLKEISKRGIALNETVIVRSGSLIKQTDFDDVYVDTDVLKAVNRGVNSDTQVVVVKTSQLTSTGNLLKDQNGERFYNADTPAYRGVASENKTLDFIAQEWLAENVIDYINNRNSTTFWGKLKRMVDIFVDRMFRGIDHVKDIEDFYESLISGRLLDRQEKLDVKRKKDWDKYMASIAGAGMKTDTMFRTAEKSFKEWVEDIDNQGDSSLWNPNDGTKTTTGEPIIIKGFHGTKANFEKFEIQEKGVRYTGDGIYFFPSSNKAQAYIGDSKDGRVIESYLDLKNPYNLYLPEDNIDWQPSNQQIRDIIEKGHDAIVVRMKDIDTETKDVVSDLIIEIVVFDLNSIKTKTELKEVWNKKQEAIAKYRQEYYRRALRPQVGGVLQPLVTLHNISAENLLLAEADGKLPAPSLAVTKPENPIRGFGEITLVGGRDIVDPEANYDNRLYSHDIYSPRVPSPEYKINNKEWQKFYYNKEIQDVFDSVDSEQYSFYQALQESDPKQGLLYVGKERSHGMKALYLKERGVEIPIVYKPANFPYQEFINTKTFKKNEILLMGDITAEKKASLEKKKEIFKEIIKEVAQNNTRLNTQYMKDVYIKDNIEHYIQSDLKFGDMLYGMYKSLRDMKELKSGDIVDRYETKDAIQKKVEEIDGGSLDKYNEWVEEYFEDVFSEPYITIGGKKEPYTTENKVRSMFGKGVKAQEGGIFSSGVNRIKAIGAKKYKSVEQAKRDSYGRLVSEAQYDEITSRQYSDLGEKAKQLAKYNKTYGGEMEFDYVPTQTLEYALADYAKGSKTMASFLSAFRKNGYEFDSIVDEYLIEKTKRWADRIFTDPVPYLEAKPKRAVALEEFSGAIMPSYYKKETNKVIHEKILKVLNENGIDRIFYVSDDTMSDKAKIINKEFDDVKYRLADNTSEASQEAELDSTVSVKLPELITMATELGANIKLQKKFRGRAKLGDFVPTGETDSRIRILRELFEPQGEEIMDGEGTVEKLPETPEQQMERIHKIEKVLAHEIGHLFDWFGGTGNMTLKRGNILGRIANLRSYTEGQFMDMSNKDIRKELKALTQIWNPFDEASVPKKYKTYRYSAKELYAEALSVFLNKPSLVKEVAPNFYQGFIEYMARKKEVQSEYFAIRDMIKQGNEVQSRVENMKKAQEIARGKRMTIDEEKEAYRKQSKWQEGITGIKMGFVNQYAPYLDKLRKAWKDKKITLSKLEEAEQLMGDLALKGNDAVKYAQDVQNEFFVPVSEAGIDIDTVGQILVLERNLGDRLDLANPHGLVYDYAKETYDFVKGQLTPAQWNLLSEKLSWWRDYNFELVRKGYEAGVYSEKFFEEIATVNKNTYTPFAVVDYIEDNYVTAGVIQAVGTTKGVENPLTTQMLKSLSLMQLTARNGAKQDVVNSLAEIFPDEIVKAEAIKDGEGRTVGFKKNPKLERAGYTQLELLEDGKRSAYYMDRYIVSMFESSLNGVGWDIARFVTAPLRMVNRIFKPAVTVMKASFQFYSNPLKDYQRSLTNLTALSGLFDKSNVASRTGKVFTAFTKEWVKNLKRSWNYAGGEIDAVTQKMLDMYVLSSNVKYEDIDIGNEKFKFDPVKNRIVYKGGVNWLETLRDWGSTIPVIKHTLVPVYDFYMRAGSTFEVNSKIAGFQYLSERVGDEKASFYTRRYVGTPDYMQKGKFTPLTNELIVFSNVGIQAITADMDLATRPKTASGYWVSTMFKIVFPKLLMLLGASILRVPIPDPDDPEKKKWVNPYDYLSEYYKSMYMAFPIGYDEESESFMFVKAPSDEVGAVIGNLVWKMATYLQGEGMKIEQLGSAIAGLIPFTTGDNPLLSIGRDWMQYAQGRNPYDDFRGRLAINTSKWNEGGMTRFTEMLKWTSNEMGLTNFSTYDKSSDTTLEKTMELPLLERMFELTNYGLQEREENDKALGKKEKNETLDGYIESYFAEPSNKKLLELQEKYVIAVKGERPEGGWSGTEKAEETRLKSEFKREILANSGNAVYKSIAKAGLDNDEKLEIINSQKKKMSDEEFKDFMAQAVRYEVVKGEMFATYAKEKNLSQDLIYKVVKESIPVLSADSNNTLLWELRKVDAMSNETLYQLAKDGLITSAGYMKYKALDSVSYDKRYGEKEDDDNKTKLF